MSKTRILQREDGEIFLFSAELEPKPGMRSGWLEKNADGSSTLTLDRGNNQIVAPGRTAAREQALLDEIASLKKRLGETPESPEIPLPPIPPELAGIAVPSGDGALNPLPDEDGTETPIENDYENPRHDLLSKRELVALILERQPDAELDSRLTKKELVGIADELVTEG